MSECSIISDLLALANPSIAEHSSRFFKTAQGEYGHGDKFLGIRVPVIRQVVKNHKQTRLAQIASILPNEYHEVRLCALLLLVERFKRKSHDEHQTIFQLYLDNIDYVNNWDLVDSSAHPIVGGYLFDKDRSLLYELVTSQNLWYRRIAIIATYFLIKKDQFDDTLQLSQLLLNDKEDLIHKAVGWMLREVGKRNFEVEYQFLLAHYKQMPRTMLRYAIEKFPEDTRQSFLQGKL